MVNTSCLSIETKGCLSAITDLFDVFKDAKCESGDSCEALFLIVFTCQMSFKPIGRHNSTHERLFVDYSPIQPTLPWPQLLLHRTHGIHWGHSDSGVVTVDISVLAWACKVRTVRHYRGSVGRRGKPISLWISECKEGSEVPVGFANEDLFEQKFCSAW